VLDLAFSVAVLASFALIGGGVWLIVKGKDKKRGALMIAAAAVTLLNVWSWSTLPSP
jgi:uncharacterized membrane protein YozB (DUF420 family)